MISHFTSNSQKLMENYVTLTVVHHHTIENIELSSNFKLYSCQKIRFSVFNTCGFLSKPHTYWIGPVGSTSAQRTGRYEQSNYLRSHAHSVAFWFLLWIERYEWDELYLNDWQGVQGPFLRKIYFFPVFWISEIEKVRSWQSSSEKFVNI